MSWLLMRMVTRLYLTLFLSALGAVLLIFLVADFADRLGAYLNHPLSEIADLYWNKALVAVHQLAPAAMLLAAGATVSTLRQRGEWVAMQALGLSRLVIVLPVAVLTVGFAVLLMGFDELVVTNAGPRVDTLMVGTFNRRGDFRFFYSPHQWFRFSRHLVYVRGGADGALLKDVSIFEVDEAFRVVRRLDAAELHHRRGIEWEARQAREREFLESGESPFETRESVPVLLAGSNDDSFRVKAGRAEFMPTLELLNQLQVRARVGLPTERLVLALHNRFAYPATGFAATMLALALALRPMRRGHLTLALVEGLAVTMTLFGLLLVARALVLGEHVTAPMAAWAPIVGLLLVSAAMWWQAEHAPR